MDTRPGIKDGLDLHGIDIEAGANDQILAAPHDEQRTCIIDTPEIARHEPAVGRQNLTRRIEVAVVTPHHPWAPYLNRSDLTRRNFTTSLIQ
ncbi:hypothetical protein D9M68_932730 [compost metagenome]